MDGNAKRLTVNGVHIHENSTESASDGVACGNIQCDPAAVTGSQMTAEYTSATTIQAKTTTDVANTTLCLLKELRKYLELEDKQLKQVVSEKNLPPGQSKVDRQYAVIENLLLRGVHDVIQNAVKAALETALLSDIRDLIHGAVQSASNNILSKLDAGVEAIKVSVLTKCAVSTATDDTNKTEPHTALCEPGSRSRMQHCNESVSVTAHADSPARDPHDDDNESTRSSSEHSTAQSWSDVMRKKSKSPQQPNNASLQRVIGKAKSTTIQGKPVNLRNNAEMKTDSLYVGNVEPITGDMLRDYIIDSYKQSFPDDLHIAKIYPLIKKPDDAINGEIRATAFRVVFDRRAKSNLLNPLIWPDNVMVREWNYNQSQARSKGDSEPNRFRTTHS